MSNNPQATLVAPGHPGNAEWLNKLNNLLEDVFQWKARLEKSKDEKKELTAQWKELTTGRIEVERDRVDRRDKYWSDQSDWIARKTQLYEDVHGSGGLLKRLEAEAQREALEDWQEFYIKGIRVIIKTELPNLEEPKSEAAGRPGNSLAHRRVGG